MMTRFVFVLMLFHFLSGGTANGQSSPSLELLDAYFAASMHDWQIPGMAVAIVQNDSVLFAKGYGLKTIGSSDSVDGNTLFAIASLSKAFTAASLAMLVDQGKLKWDDRVTDYLPYFQMYDPYATREMTVRDLLSHRSGSHTYGGDLIWYGTHYVRKEVIERVRYLKPRYSFRERYGYQNIMFLAAGEIIPAVMGQSWDEFVRDSFFVPLGMKRTNTSVKELSIAGNVATPHTEVGGRIIAVPYRDVDNVGSAAAVNSSIHDLTRWMRMWLREDSVSTAGRLSDRAKHEVWTPLTVVPLSMSAMKLNPWRNFNAAALGWFAHDYRGWRVLTHGGAMDGMISRIALVPGKKLGIVVLTNSINSLPPALIYRILDAYSGGSDRDWSGEALTRKMKAEQDEIEKEAVAKKNRVTNSRPSLPLQDYAGVFRSQMYGDVKVESEGGKLTARFVPTASYVADLSHWHFDTFRIQMRDPTLPQKGWATFVLGADGKPSELRIDIPNPDFDFTELELKRVR